MTNRKAGWPLAAGAGLAAAGAALGVAELAAGLLGRPGSAPLLAVGAAGIDLTPQWLKDFAIRNFGTHDKLVLLTGLGVGIAVFAVVIGLLARRRPVFGMVGMGVLGVAGGLAALTRPGAGPAGAHPWHGRPPGRAVLRCRSQGLRRRRPQTLTDAQQKQEP